MFNLEIQVKKNNRSLAIAVTVAKYLEVIYIFSPKQNIKHKNRKFHRMDTCSIKNGELNTYTKKSSKSKKYVQPGDKKDTFLVE